MKCFALALVGLFVSLSTFAADLQPVFEALKNEAVDYEPSGQVCEQVARLQFAQKYKPEQYQITGGIEYNVLNRTIGELDLVILDRKSQAVVLVGEVKCWKSLDGALDKAHDQRSRFINTLQKHGENIVFEAKDGGEYHAQQFQSPSPKFISIAQAGSTKHGFDAELGYSLHELMQLRTMLLKCQDQGQCPRP